MTMWKKIDFFFFFGTHSVCEVVQLYTHKGCSIYSIEATNTSATRLTGKLER